MKVFIDISLEYKNAVRYILEIFFKNKKIDFLFVESPDIAEFIVSNSSNSDIQISEEFFENIYNGVFDFNCFFKNDCTVKTKNGSSDYLCSAFYMINSIQEFSGKDPDEYNRFKYSNSYQYQFKNVEENLVQECFDKLCKSNGKLNTQKQGNSKTKFFLSHDIDTVYGAFIQDGYNAFKQKRFDIVLKLFINAIIQKPDWMNIDKIMNIESEYDYKSAFYWIVNKGKLNKSERNSDYSINNSSIRSMINLVNEKGWENGLHKSISKESFKEEIEKLGFMPSGNRYHYLKFNLPSAYKELQSSGIRLDSSLGFAEVVGFRNSYGLPFHPYDFENNKPFYFLEVPLNVMDQTFFGYQKLAPEQVSKKVISFFEKNKSNCVISVLWHNNFFSNYKFKGYLDAYKEILAYLYEEKFECVNQKELLNNKY